MSRLVPWLHFGLRQSLYALLALTLVVLAGRLALSQASRYKPVIEARLSAALHAPVHIGAVEAHWVGLEPQITLDNLGIHDPARPASTLLNVRRIHIELALWQSLKHRDWRLEAQTRGVGLHVTEQTPGQWRIEELSALESGPTETRDRMLAWVLKQAQWQLDDIRLDVRPYGQPALTLAGLSLVNRNRSGAHQLRLNGKLDGQAFGLYANLNHEGPVTAPASWQGLAYARLAPHALESWLSHLSLPEGLTIPQLNAGGEFWAGVQQGRVRSLTARLAVPAALFGYGQQLYLTKGFSGLLSWRRDADGWRFSAEQLAGELNQQPWPVHTLAVRSTSRALELALRDLLLDPLPELTAGLDLPSPLQRWLSQARPRGRLDSFAATLAVDAGQPRTLLTASGQLSAFSAEASSDYPGVHNLNGWFVHGTRGGQAGVHIVDGQLDLRQVYRVPTPVTKLDARLRWRDEGDSWRLDSDAITVANADAHGQALVSLSVPKAEPDAATMQLLAHIEDGRLDSVWRYVPWPPAGDDTLAWLKSALLAGRIERGDFLYDGVLIDRPGRPPSTMQMNFAVRNGRLAYAPGWPQMSRMDADVGIRNHHLWVDASNAQIYQSIAQKIHADIPELNAPVLTVNAELDSVGEDVLRLFQETPLKQDAGRVADLLVIKGELAGALELKIPLASDAKEPVQVNVTAELPGNPVLLRQASEFDLWLSGIVNYQTGHGLSSHALPGFFLGQPVTVRLQSLLDNSMGDMVALQVQANGQLTPGNLKPWLGELTHAMRGSAQYQAALTVPISSDPVHIAFNSDLAGWQIDLPEPLGKKTEATRLHYEMQLADGKENTAYFMYGSRIQGGLGLRDGRVSRAQVQLGEVWNGELPDAGLWVKGHLNSLNIDDWLPWLRPQAGNTVSRSVGAALPELQGFIVDVDRMSYAGYQLRDVRMGLEEQEERAWRLQILSNDLSGEVLMPHNRQQPMTLNLQTLNLPFETRTGRAASRTRPAEDWVMPRMNVHVADLALKAWPHFPHTRLDTQVQPTGRGLRLGQLHVSSPAFTVEGTLDWQWRGVETTSYSGQINITDIANLFAAFDRAPLLNSRDGKAELSLRWPGDPSDLGPGALDGQLELELNHGRVLNLNRAVSLSRLLGVLDSDNFRRRLRLDFSDVTQKGMAFDTIRFDAGIENGVMNNRLVFASPSLSARGQGSANLVTTDLDQYLDVSVPISSAVPYAAAVVAGPLVGGALVAAEAMLDTPLTKMTTLHYQVKGQWQNPQVERMKKPILPWRNPFKSKGKGKQP